MECSSQWNLSRQLDHLTWFDRRISDSWHQDIFPFYWEKSLPKFSQHILLNILIYLLIFLFNTFHTFLILPICLHGYDYFHLNLFQKFRIWWSQSRSEEKPIIKRLEDLCSHLVMVNQFISPSLLFLPIKALDPIWMTLLLTSTCNFLPGCQHISFWQIIPRLRLTLLIYHFLPIQLISRPSFSMPMWLFKVFKEIMPFQILSLKLLPTSNSRL